MLATIDISLYPLNDAYKSIIIDFVKSLRTHEKLRVETDGMRTQIIGEYDTLMYILQGEMKEVLNVTKAVFIIKLARGERSIDNLTDSLKFPD